MADEVLVREEGHWGLELVHDCQNPKVDVIFVHGVAVNPQFAWRHQVEVDGKKTGEVINWLKDDNMLPKELENARILAFNYESQWLKSNAEVRPRSVGSSLMDAITQERRDGAKKKGTDEPQKRPIVFVGHSFGGIVIEQGITIAICDGNSNSDVPKCTVGIALLGTPHAGSEMATFAVTLAKIAQVAQVFGAQASDKTIMEALRADASMMHDMVDTFLTWVNKHSVDVRCFFEEKMTNYGGKGGLTGFIGGRVNEKVVTEVSACLAGRRRYALATDHPKMAKFDGPTNASYIKVKNVLKEMCEDNLEKARLRFDPRPFVQDNSLINAVNLECQKALFISWPDAELKGIKRRLGDRTPHTCEWLLVKDDYIKWLNEPRPQVLRLVGNPGMGKSMIITYLIEELTQTLKITPHMALAFHFCDNRNQSSNTATAVVRQMLFQLFQQRPNHFEILQKAYDVQGPKLFQDFDTLWDILKAVIKVYGEGELFLLIDALDECDEKSRSLLMDGMKEITQDNLNVRVFFTCRPEADIEQKYRSKNDRTLSCHIKGSDIDRDIQLYMADKVPKLCEGKAWGQPEIDLITNNLMEKANGIFLWCSFVLQDIAKVQIKSDIEACLNDLPEDLQGVYERITGNFVEKIRPVAKMVLQIVTGARRPLTVPELTMTYVLADECPRRWPNKTLPPKSETDQLDDVYLCCGRLLRWDDVTNTVNLVHQSAKDYLLASYLIKPPLVDTRDNAAINTKETNIKMNNLFLEIIFRYFSLTTFDHLQHRMVFDAEWNIDWECSWWEMEPSPAFMTYCGREWELHARDTETHAEAAKTDGMEKFNAYMRPSTRNSWLRKAAMSGNKPFVHWLLENEAERDSTDFRGWTALQLAAKHGKKEVIEYLVKERKADVNGKASHIDGRTPIQTAAEEGLDDVITLLIELEADVNSPPAKIHGRTALQAASEKAQIETIKLLLDQNDLDLDSAGAEVSGVTALLAGAGSGGEWQMGKNIHRTIKQRSRLPGSAEIDTQKIAEEDQQDRDQRQKEEHDHEQVVELLVEGGAHLIPNQFKWTALHAAVERESDKMVEQILSIEEVDSNVKGYHDGTPLHSAKAKANEELTRILEEHNGTDECPYSKLDLDAMMKYIRAVLTRLMIKSNTERFFFIQSYIPIYHVIYSYCAEGTDDQNDNPPVEQGGRRGELVYRDVDAWLKSYVMWNQKLIWDTPLGNDFLTVYLREWKLFKRGAYYVGRMLRYLTRHWVKHQREELKHKDVRDIADLFFHRWRAGMTGQFRKELKKRMVKVSKGIDAMENKDTRVLDAINESLNGPFEEFKEIFASSKDYFKKFKDIKWDDNDVIEDFEVILRELSDEFVVESEVWKQKVASEDGKKQEQNIREQKKKELGNFNLRTFKIKFWTEEAQNFFLDKVEPHFLAPYSGGRRAEISRDLDQLWDMLRHDDIEAKERAEKKAKNLAAVNANAANDINGIHADGEDTNMANGIQQTPLKEATKATA